MNKPVKQEHTPSRDKYDWIAMTIVTSIAFAIALLCHRCTEAHAFAQAPSPRYSLGSASQIDFDSLADAIYQAEGAQQGELYGIHSVPYRSEAEAREICLRTLKHKYQQWNKQGNFIHWLSFKYCPKNHRIWEKNVKFYYSKFQRQIMAIDRNSNARYT